MYRTPTARLLAKKHSTSATARLGSSSTKKTTIAIPAVNNSTHQQDDPCQTTIATTKDQLRAQLLENQQRFLAYVASVVEERDALRQENGTLREQRQQAARAISALSKQYLGGGGETLLEAVSATPKSNVPSTGVHSPALNNTFKPKKNECATDFIVGDTASGFRCGLCLKHHGDAKVYWNRNYCYHHIRDIHKVQAKLHIPLPTVHYDPKKSCAKQFFEQVGQNRWKCKACAGAGRELVVGGRSTSGHLRTMHMGKKKKK